MFVVLSSYPALIKNNKNNGQSSYLGRRDSLRIFKLYLPINLFNSIKLMSKFYRVSISKMMTELLERGYLEILKTNTKEE